MALKWGISKDGRGFVRFFPEDLAIDLLAICGTDRILNSKLC